MKKQLITIHKVKPEVSYSISLNKYLFVFEVKLTKTKHKNEWKVEIISKEK